MTKKLFILLFVLFCFGSYAQTKQRSAVAEKDYVAYLFAYFTGNSIEDEAVRYAVSNDARSFYTLNSNMPVIDSRKISSTGGVRDPHILRSQDGKTFFMVLTDMVSAKGWDSNRAMVLLKSNNLIDWTSSVVNIQKKYKGYEKLLRVWAPQTIFNPEVGKYMIYWSMKLDGGTDIIYYSYANADFTDLETEPKVLFIPKTGVSCIDGDIVLKDSLYHMFYKTEGFGDGIRKATTSSLTSGKWTEYDQYKQSTKQSVEGACVFKIINSEKYILMYDVYRAGKYQFTETSDLDNFKIIDDSISMDFHPRHGTIIPITRKELKTLITKYGKPAGFEMADANNPVLEGYFADPSILFAQKAGKYYLYPTSDGFNGWSGTYFKVFSSENLKDWADEGVMLDLKTDVSWADRNAWAPTIIEKKVKRNKYKYYYYFTAAQKIGVAVADSPTGPFVDAGKPVVDKRPDGVKGGQEIDPDVFCDPVSKKNYLYWGNGYMAVAELSKDMTSIVEKTVTVITPDKTFREGTCVFYRNGTYYFLWSEDDTRSPNYRVRYGTSTSPVGPISIPAQNLVLEKDASKGIYGTGHNSVIQVPEKDEWHIVYHRFNRPNGIKIGDAAGFHREVCIDKLEFNPDGSIIQVVPSL